VRHVWILRHAKAAKDGTEGDDHSRPLTGRGRRQAAQVATLLAERAKTGKPVPDLVLSSSAARALQTAEAAHRALSDVPLEIDRSLYRAGPDDVIERLRLLAEPTLAPMVVGHNPTFHELALELVGSDDAEGRARLEDGFPTAVVAVVACDIERWADLAPGAGRLEELFLPSR